eukprot:Blabericola_migrator_1__6907@NODE_349_length_9523_cov_128_512902_g280_i0_p5_GENE_NODE_349_length_9523_cov_128_512902_g280_i0NODE_349_length_9523_cov_128_512902_g280_i0_p5_ORF_typecomplete_len218_score32_38_NODE_349_length_9523_cov_128_512902_g280_i025743227
MNRCSMKLNDEALKDEGKVFGRLVTGSTAAPLQMSEVSSTSSCGTSVHNPRLFRDLSSQATAPPLFGSDLSLDGDDEEGTTSPLGWRPPPPVAPKFYPYHPPLYYPYSVEVGHFVPPLSPISTGYQSPTEAYYDPYWVMAPALPDTEDDMFCQRESDVSLYHDEDFEEDSFHHVRRRRRRDRFFSRFSAKVIHKMQQKFAGGTLSSGQCCLIGNHSH